MQNMRKSVNTNENSGEVLKQKERHIVSWSQEEDDILREQIRIHGTENWAIIASKFKDKTTRQCRRRWFTYLNSDFKKGGWSPEEDMLLCEAQKIFGNRWTEIAKVVSGRTDNAVKNRFSTLCKKKAKHEALAKENKNSYINLNNKRVISQNEFNASISETAAPLKKIRRAHIPDVLENSNHGNNFVQERGMDNQLLRPPFAVLFPNFHNAGNLPTQHHINAKDNKIHGTFLKKDDPKIIALMQQAELLSSLAVKVNADNTDQSLENAWKVLQDFLKQTKESDLLKASDMDSQLENFKGLMEELRCSNEGSRPSWSQPDLYEESSGSSEYSTGSTFLSQATSDKTMQCQSDLCGLHQDNEMELQSTPIGRQDGINEDENGIVSHAGKEQADILPPCAEVGLYERADCALSSAEFSSPLQVTPLFRSLAAGIPSPKFSESERNFLLKTLGMESMSPDRDTSTNPSQPPPCKRVLLHSL